MPQQLQKGANAPIPSGKLVIQARHKGPDTDLSALLLTSGSRVRTDKDFVFYGNEASPEGSVRYLSKQTINGANVQEFAIDLAAVPADIDRIALTLTIDATTKATFATIGELTVSVFADKGSSREELASCQPQGTSENAFIIVEVYRKQGAWKVRHVAQGFNNGLAGIATAFGVDISDDGTGSTSAQPTPPPPGKINLTKVQRVTQELEAKGHRLVNLQKSAAVCLTKAGMDNMVARVIKVLDASGSTQRMWPDIMQAVLDRLATLALNLDDNGELEFWGYATGNKQYANVTLDNLDGYVARIMKEGKGGWSSSNGILPGLGYDNNEPPVMREVLKAAKETPKLPTLCIFVTDGGIDKDRLIEQVLVEASNHPVFWQFVGLGGQSYGILERFDKMAGRTVDNAGFFAIDDYRSVSDAELYQRLLSEFPTWLRTVRAKGILQS